MHIGKTKMKIITRTIEHQQDSFTGKLGSLDANKNCLECHGQFDSINPITLSTEQQYRRGKIRESFETEKAKRKNRRRVLNHHEGNIVKRNTWTPYFVKLTKKETNTKN